MRSVQVSSIAALVLAGHWHEFWLCCELRPCSLNLLQQHCAAYRRAKQEQMLQNASRSNNSDLTQPPPLLLLNKHLIHIKASGWIKPRYSLLPLKSFTNTSLALKHASALCQDFWSYSAKTLNIILSINYFSLCKLAQKKKSCRSSLVTLMIAGDNDSLHKDMFKRELKLFLWNLFTSYTDK